MRWNLNGWPKAVPTHPALPMLGIGRGGGEAYLTWPTQLPSPRIDQRTGIKTARCRLPTSSYPHSHDWDRRRNSP